MACDRAAAPLGVILPNYGAALAAEELANVAVAAEAAGFHSAWVTDHLMVPDEYAGVYGTIAEALVSLGFLAAPDAAARAWRLRSGRSSAESARRAETAHHTRLPLGRADSYGGGSGLDGEGFATLGAGFEGRGRLLDEWLELAGSVFQQMPGRVRYEGRTLSLDGWMAPGLVRAGGPELWVAGVSRATLRRAALTGSGTRSRSRPTRWRAWRLICASDGRIAASSSVSAFTSSVNLVSVTTSAAGTRSPVLRSGWRRGSASTSRRAPTGSSSTSITASLASRTEVGRFAEEVGLSSGADLSACSYRFWMDSSGSDRECRTDDIHDDIAPDSGSRVVGLTLFS